MTIRLVISLFRCGLDSTDWWWTAAHGSKLQKYDFRTWRKVEWLPRKSAGQILHRRSKQKSNWWFRFMKIFKNTKKLKLSPCYSILHSYCVKISVGRKKLSLRPKIKFPKNTKILMLVFPFHLKLLSILEIFTVYSQVQKSHALVTGIKIRLYG